MVTLLSWRNQLLQSAGAVVGMHLKPICLRHLLNQRDNIHIRHQPTIFPRLRTTMAIIIIIHTTGLQSTMSEPGCNANQQLQPSAFQPQPALRQLHDNAVAALASPCPATSWACKKLVRALLPEGDIQQDHQRQDGSRSQCGCHPRLQD